MSSLWSYLRTRTRDAMLAGMQDALERAEGGEGGDAASAQLVNPPSATPTQRPNESPIVLEESAEPPLLEDAPPVEKTTARASTLEGTLSAADKVHEKMLISSQPLDPVEERFRQTNPNLAPPYAGPAPRKRGRPRKNPEK